MGNKVTIHTTVEQVNGVIKVTACGNWEEGVAGEAYHSQSVRELDVIAATTQAGVTRDELIEATKRDALRELVTMLNVHGVL